MTEPQQQPPGTLDAPRNKADHGEDGFEEAGRQAAGDLAPAARPIL